MILLEFNELSPALMETFIDQGYLPNFKRLRDSSQVFITDAEEAAVSRIGLCIEYWEIAAQSRSSFATATA
jgi:hypothetical protein